MDNDKRKKVYDVLTSKTGYKDSFDDFNKFMDDGAARRKVYDVLREQTGYRDSFEDFDKFMSSSHQGEMPVPIVPMRPTEPDLSFSNPSAGKFVQNGLDANEELLNDVKAEPVKDGMGRSYFPVKPQKVMEDEIRREYQVEPIESQINNAIVANEEAIRRIEQGKTEDYDRKAEEHPFLHALGGFARQHEGRVPDVNPSNDKEALRNLYAERNKLEEAKKVIEASRTDGILSNIGAGVKDAVTDMGFYDFGMTEMSDNSRLLGIKAKLDNKQPLTEDEQKLLNAAALAQGVQSSHQDRISPWYTAGQTTANMAPFMAEMLVNPAAGLGKAAQKAVTKKVSGLVGKSLTRKMLPKLSRVAGDVAGASVMTGTTGIMRTVADAEGRMLGDVNSSIRDGEIVGNGFSGGLDAGEASAKAFGANTIENWSEMLGEYFAPALRGMGMVADKGMRKMGLGRVSDFISDINSTSLARGIDDFLEKTQWNGPIGEIAEEEAGIIANSYITGDNKLSDLTDPRLQLDIVLGVGLFGGFVSGMKTIGYRSPSKIAEKDLKRAEKNASSMFDNWEDIRLEIENTDEEQLPDTLNSIIGHAAGNDNAKKAAIVDYAYSLQKWRGVNAAKLKQTVENPAEAQNLVENEENGTGVEAIPEFDKVSVYRNFKRAERKVAQALPNTPIEKIEDVTDVDKFAADNGLNEEQKSAVTDYMAAKEPYSIYQSDVEARKEVVKSNAREQAVKDAERTSNPDTGFITQVKRKFSETPVYLVGGNLSFGDDGLLDRSNSTETVYYLDENGKRLPAPAEDFDSIVSQSSKEELVANAEAQATADFDAQENESLASPEILPPGIGETVSLDGGTYVIEGADNDNPGNFSALKLNTDGEIEVTPGLSEQISLSPDEYYEAKETELWKNDGIQPEQPVGKVDEVVAPALVQGVDKMPEISAENTSGPEMEDNKVSEETPEQRLQKVVDSLPKKKDGNIDYKALTPQQRFDYTSAAESPEVAIEDLKSDVAVKNEELEKINARLEKAIGGERVELRDTIRSKKKELDELTAFFQSVVPEQPDTSVNEEQPSVPEDVRTDEDYVEWVADNSDDAEEVLGAYSVAKELASHEQTLKPWQRELLGRKVSTSSFVRFGDRNHITGTLAKGWLRKDGEEIDSIAQELTANGVDVSEQDIVDFILDNPSNRVSEISDTMRSLSSRFSEIATKETGIPVGGPESNTGKLYIQLKEANKKIDELTDEQKADMRNALIADMDASDVQRSGDYYESLADYAEQYDRFRDEMNAEEADEAVIRQMEAESPTLYHGGFTADELDDIYSQIENDNGTERQTEDSGETQPALSGDEIEQREEPGIPDAVGAEDSESEGQDSGVVPDIEEIQDNTLDNEDESLSLHLNSKEEENGTISESVPQGERREETPQNGSLEEATDRLRERSRANEEARSRSGKTLSFQEKLAEEARETEAYAKEKGSWIPMSKVFDLGASGPSGNEADTYISQDNHIYKVNNLMNSKGILPLLERVALHNAIFPSSQYELTGFTGFEGGNVYPVLRQRYVPNATLSSPEEIDSYMRSLGFKQTGEAAYSNGDVVISDLRPRNVLKDTDGDLYVVDADFKKEDAVSFEASPISPGENVLDYAERISREKEMHDVRQSVDTNPTDAQKEAGNYKKGHIRLDGYDITIENPKGSERSGTDAKGGKWSVTMNNDYGYIRGTQGVDGDHIDVFLSDDPTTGNVYVIDQVKEDGSFDEHKVMYGFGSALAAKRAYLSNYSKGWNGLGKITQVSKDEFRKWVNSSRRKTKPFAEYKSVKMESDVRTDRQGNPVDADGKLIIEGNRLVTDKRYAELLERMRKKLGGQMNMGVDPEILAIGTEMAVYHIEKGARKFAEYAKAMIADLGDVIRPYLKSFYNGARDLPEMQELAKNMDSYNDVSSFDVVNFDKVIPDVINGIATMAEEKEIKRQADVANAAIKKVRSKNKKKNNNVSLPLGDLFNQNIEEYGKEQRKESDSGSEGNQGTNGQLGEGAWEEDRKSGLQGETGSVSGRDGADADRGGRVHGVSVGRQSSVKRNRNNYSFGDSHIDVPSGDVAKLKANVAAIRTLKEIEESGLPATDEQKAILAKYSGWGGLSNALNDEKYNARKSYYGADKNWNEKYLPYYEQLIELLTPEEFRSAVQSTTTSHYTPETVIRSMWDIAGRIGVKGGDVSEPAMGIGRIIGLMPDETSSRSRISGYEIDSLSGRISKALYPDANIKVQGYETEFFPQSKDLVITNVPFGKQAPYDKALEKTLKKQMKGAYNLHNYFIAKSLLELKEGGIGIFVTSSATMDGASSRFREFASSGGFDLVGAIRLPNDAFQKDAGTSVTADVLVFRRRKSGEKPNEINFISTTQIGEGNYQENGETRTKPIMVNEYFASHPEMMLGEMMTAYDAGSGGLYSGASQTLKAKPGMDLQKALDAAVKKLTENVNIGIENADSRLENTEKEQTTLKNGTLSVKDGKVYVAMNGVLEEIAVKDKFVYSGKTRKTADAVNEYNELKSTLRELISEEQKKGGNPEPLRKKLNEQYDGFVGKYGTLNRNKALDDVFDEDFEHNLPLSLETVRRVPSPTGKSMVYEVEKGKGILDKRVNYPVEEPTKADSVKDAINISRSYKGNIDIPYIARLTGKGEEEVTEEMLRDGSAYRDPLTGTLVDRATYLSGNVKSKLEDARAMAENDPAFDKNVADLEKVQPETIRFGDISYRLGTPWIPAQYINEFAENVLGISGVDVTYMPSLNEFVVGKHARISDFEKSGAIGTDRVGAIDLFAYAINQRKPKIYDEHTEYGPSGSIKVRTVNEAETQAAAEKIMEISDKFIEYIDGRKGIHRELERIYNDKYNNYVLKKYELPSFSHMEKDEDGKEKMVTHYPNSNTSISMREHQARAIQRSIEGSTLLAHQVGTGKTFTMITTAMEMRRLGLARKPMIVVQNATLEDFVKDFYRLYPGANVLAPGKNERSAENRTRLFNLIATGDFDAIVIPQSFMQFIPDDEGRKKELIQKRIDEYEEVLNNIEDYGLKKRIQKELDDMRDTLEGVEKGKKRSVKDKAKAADRIKSKMERQLDRKTDNVMTFEQMGVDALFIDEAHNFKKIGFASKMNNVKGVDTSASQRANSLLLKAKWVQEKNGGRNVILATGTPITNTMAEVWTMMNFVSPEILEDYDIKNFDDFATTFGTVEPSLEFTATGNFKIADRFKSYVNVPELVKAFRSHTDVVLTEDVKEFKEGNNVPEMKDGKIESVVMDKNEDLEDVMQVLVKRLEEYNEMTGKEKREWSALPLVVFTKAKQAAIDLRLLNPSYADNPNSKTNHVVSNVLNLYKESTPDKGTQLVFCDSYQSPGEKPQMDLFDYDSGTPRFNLYEDIKRKLVEGGIPANEIAIVNNYDGERRKNLFEKVRNGDVRVLLGSTEKMGVGVNVQDRLFALHHVDAPIRPMDFEQRNGRILRQGNLYATWKKPVHVMTYGVMGTLDATAYDRLRIKQEFINQMMKGNVDGRVMEEQDDENPSGMTFNQMAATLSGDKTAQLLFVAENKLKKLRNLKRSDANSKSGMAESIEGARSRIKMLESKKKVYEKASLIVEKYFPNGIESVEVGDSNITEKFGASLDSVISAYDEAYSLNRGTAPLRMSLNGGQAEVVVHFNEGRMVYELYAGNEHIVEGRQFNGGRGLISSLEHQLKVSKNNLADVERDIAENEKRIEGLERAISAPWGKEEELKAAEKEVDELRNRLEEQARKNSKESRKTEDGAVHFREDETENDINLELDDIVSAVERLSSRLNTPVHIVHSLDELMDGAARRAIMSGRRGIKSWFTDEEVALYLPHATGTDDARRSVLHEVVGHKGLRDLFGKKGFDGMMEKLYGQLPDDVRREIHDTAKDKYSGDIAVAMDEYLAGQAELDETPSWWNRVVSAVRGFLREMGVDVLLSSNDVKYLLWKSKNRLMNTDNGLAVINKIAAGEAMKEKLHIGEYSRTPEQEKADYDRAVKVVGDFAGSHAGAANALVIRSRDLMRRQLEARGISAEDIEKYEQWFDEKGTCAFWSPKYQTIFVLNKSVSEKEINGYLWHENVHHAFDVLYGSEEKKSRIARLYEELSSYSASDFAHIEGLYVDESVETQKEECVTALFEELTKRYEGKTEDVISKMQGKGIISDSTLKELYNYIHYGTKEGYGSRRIRPGFDGFLEKPVEEKTMEVRNSDGDFRRSAESEGSGHPVRGMVEEGAGSISGTGESGTEERNKGNRPLGRALDTGYELDMRNSGDAGHHKEEKGAGSQGTEPRAKEGNQTGEGVTRFRDTTGDKPSDGTVEQYEEELKKQSFKAKEAYQDSMLALKKLQDVVVKRSGKALKSFEDAYTAENHLSSINTAEVESYGEHFFRPMIEAIGELVNNGNSYEDVKRYVFAKHGLERNEVFAERDARNAVTEKYWREKELVNRQYYDGKLMEDEYEEKMQGIQQAEKDFYEKQYEENRLRDYSGLTALTGEKEDYEDAAQAIVDEFERGNDVTELWRTINNATKETLNKTYESGLMDKATYERVRVQFKHYVPLRGWNEKTAADVYEYLQSEVSPVNATMRTAKGRMSLADDPFATIGNMAESNIFMSNRNLMKQRFMNMVLNHPSDVVSLSEAWYVKDASTGDWVLSAPDILENDSSDEIRRKIEEHEERMRLLSKDGDATKVKEGLNIDYRISARQAKEHMVVVKRNGKEYVMYINGNPRVAQAINGMTNPNVNEHPVWKWIGNLNRQLAANFTTRNPAFVATNLSRDLIYAVSSTYVKEGTEYGNRYLKNIPKAMKVVMRNLRGKGGNSIEDIYFREFLANGGETGYADLKDVKAYKKFVEHELGKITGKKDYFKYLKACASFFSLLNRWAENVSRFDAYMTSREMGKNVFDSVSGAKEVTVNFNKKGAGYKTKGFFGLTSGTFRELFLFFNAAVQSLTNFSKMAYNYKKGFVKMVGGFAVAGYLVPMLNGLALSLFGDDGDDDYYNNLPEWVRRNNICIYRGNGKFITIPLPIELRAFYGLGEMAYQVSAGNTHGAWKIGYDAINQITELLPINPLGNNGDILSSFTPDIAKPIVQLSRNKDYTGKPIYKENSFNENMPEWTKTYNGTTKWLKNLSEWTNELTGGNKYKRGWVDVNPAKVEHLFESYFGGMAKTINQASNTLVAGVESAVNGEMSEDLVWRNVPILNRFVSDGSDDRTSFSKVNSRYYELYDVYKDVKQQFSGYKKEILSGNLGYLEDLSELQNSREFDIYAVFEKYRKSMDKLNKLEKSFPESSKSERKEVEKSIMNIKKEIVRAVDGE